MNIGIKDYGKYIDNEIGKIGTSKININKNYANLHFSIPLYNSDLEYGGLNLSLNFSLSSINTNNLFGKGFKLNYFQAVSEYTGNIDTTICDSFGSIQEYKFGEFNVETGLIILPFYDKDTYESYSTVKDLNGNIYSYNFYGSGSQIGYGFPDQISLPTQGVIKIKQDYNKIYINNIEQAKLEMAIEDDYIIDKITNLEVSDGNLLKGRISFNYDNDDHLTSIKYYNHNNIIIKEINLNFDNVNNIINVNDVRNNILHKYYFYNSSTVYKLEAYKNNYQIYKKEIEYYDNYSVVTDTKGRKFYTYFNKDIPMYDIDYRGRIQSYIFNNNKKLVKKSDLHYNSYEASSLHNLVKNGYFLNNQSYWSFNGTTGWIAERTFIPSSEPFLTALGTNCIMIDNTRVTSSTSFSQIIKLTGTKGDNLSLILWSLNQTPNTDIKNRYINIRLIKDNSNVTELESKLDVFESVYNLWEYHTLSLFAQDDYDSIEIKITTPDRTKYLYAAIQLYNRGLETFFHYNENGIINNINYSNKITTFDFDKQNNIKETYKSNLNDKRQVYNDKGKLIKESTDKGAVISYNYDSNNRIQETIKKSKNKFLKSSASYDGIIIDNTNLKKNEFLSERNQRIQEIKEKKSNNTKQYIDEKGSVTYFDYDSYGNLDFMYMNQNDDQFSIDYKYKDNLIIKKYTTQSGMIYEYSYDKIDRLESVDIIYDYEADGTPKSVNNLEKNYRNFPYDEIESKTYGKFGDKYIFQYDNLDRIWKIIFVAKNTTDEVLKCEYEYDCLDRVKTIKDFIDNEDIIKKQYDYNVNNQVISISEFRNNDLVYKKNLIYDNNGNIINEIYDNLQTNKIIKQSDRLDNYSLDTVQNYCADFKYNNHKVLSCFFNDEEYDPESKGIVTSRDLTSYSINEIGMAEKHVIRQEIGEKQIAEKGKFFNWINLDDTSDNPGYKFFNSAVKYAGIYKTIMFWFYSDNNNKNLNKYLLSIGDNISKNFLGVFINEYNDICLTLTDSYMRETTKISGDIKNGWNFFALNYSVREELGDGFPMFSEYTIYLNDDKTSISGTGLNNYISIKENTLINIGCQRLGTNKYNKFTGRIASLIITDDYLIIDSKIGEYKNNLYKYFLNPEEKKYLNESLETVSASSTNIFTPDEKFGLNYINFNNSLDSFSGIKPFIFSNESNLYKRIFTINPYIRRDVYNADGATLAYKFGLSTSGTLAMRCFITESLSKQYLFDNQDGANERMALYRDNTKQLILQLGANKYYTGIIIENNIWRFVSVSWHTVTLAQPESGYKLYFTIRCGDSLYNTHKYTSFKYSDMICYVGIGIENDINYPLHGQIEMLSYSSIDLSLETHNNYLKGFDNLCCTNEYDSLDFLKRSTISRLDNNILSYDYRYKEIPEISGDVRVIPDITNLSIYNNKFKKDYNYSYDEIGNIEKIYLNGVIKNSYIYDNLNRLKCDYNHSNNNSTNFVYDSNGNIKNKTKWDGINQFIHMFEYDDIVKDRLISIYKDDVRDTITKKFEYKDNLFGNPTFFGTGEGDNRLGIFYTWEGRRLTNYKDNTTKLNIDYTYDNQSLRMSKIINNKKINYVYDGDKLIAEIDTTNSLNNKYFTYDNGNNLISIKYSNKNYYYVRELTGNIIGLVDDSGSFMVEYEYDAFGQILKISGLMKDSLGKANPFIYKCYYYDFETSMYYCKNRYYVPEWCRWLNADSIDYLDPETLHGLNLFAYCNNNPIMRFDPEGNFPKWAKWLVGGAVLAVMVIGGAAAAVVLGALIGAGQSYISDVDKNLKDGFQLSDLNTFKDNWVEQALKYTLSGTFGAISAYVGGSHTANIFSKGIITGACDTMNDLINGKIENGSQLLSNFIKNVFVNTVTCGVINRAEAINPINIGSLNKPFNKIVNFAIKGTEHILSNLGQNSGNICQVINLF